MFGFLKRAVLRFEIARIDLRLGDVLVIKANRSITGWEAQRIRESIRHMAGDYRVLVLDGALDMSVMTAPPKCDDDVTMGVLPRTVPPPPPPTTVMKGGFPKPFWIK